MALNPQRQWMSFEAYLVLDLNSPDVKYEYIDGSAVAMSGGTLNHSALGLRIGRLLEEELGTQGPCRVYNSDARIKLKHACLHPDAVVSCDIADRGEITYLSSPRLVVEVLSPSTELFNRNGKFKYYQEAVSLQEYVLINYRFQLVEVFSRKGDEWPYRSYGANEVIELASLDIQIAVDDLYAGLDIPAQVEVPEDV